MLTVVDKLGAMVLALLQEMGRMLNFVLYAVYTCVRTPAKPVHTLKQLRFIGAKSFFVIFRRPPPQPQKADADFHRPTSVLNVSGPWTVKFDPRWGGPESVVFEKLEDWTKRPEPGIRYYSGKATYTKTFDLPASIGRAEDRSSQRIFLDLGKVKNLAEVRLNGNPVDPLELVGTVDADLLVELTPTNLKTGEPGVSLIRAALDRKMNVVTANKGPMVLEVNSSPGLEGIETATGVDVASRIIKFIEDNAHVRSLRRDRIKV